MAEGAAAPDCAAKEVEDHGYCGRGGACRGAPPLALGEPVASRPTRKSSGFGVVRPVGDTITFSWSGAMTWTWKDGRRDARDTDRGTGFIATPGR